MMKTILLLAILGCLVPSLAGAEETAQRMLLMDLKATLVEPEVVGLVNNMVSTELAHKKGFELITGADMRQMVELEAEKQSLGCADDSSCLSELAGAMGARYVVFGEMGKLGSFYLLTLNLFDSKMAKSAARDTLRVKSIDELVEKLPPLINMLVDEIRAKDSFSIASEGDGSKVRVVMRNAYLKDGHLKGYAVNHPKLGDGPLKSSAVLGITYDLRGTAKVKTKNTNYVIETTDWKVRPDNHPLNSGEKFAKAPAALPSGTEDSASRTPQVEPKVVQGGSTLLVASGIALATVGLATTGFGAWGLTYFDGIMTTAESTKSQRELALVAYEGSLIFMGTGLVAAAAGGYFLFAPQFENGGE